MKIDSKELAKIGQMQSVTTTNAAAVHTNITWTGSIDSFTSWSEPFRVDVIDTGHSIEMIYVQHRINRIWSGEIPQNPERRVFKIVYSCVNGEWHKSEPIYGQNEFYQF
jgi:hypothetical protein